MMDEFEKAAAQAEARQAEPVTEAKKELAPLRAEAEKVLADIEALARKAGPSISAAQARLGRAHALGVDHLQLRLDLQEASRIMDGGPVGLRAFIKKIDDLDSWAVGQRIPLRFPGELSGYKGCGGRLKELTKRIGQGLGELAEALSAASV